MRGIITAMTRTGSGGPPLPRRAVLAGAAALGATGLVAGLAACSPDRATPPPPPDPDVVLRLKVATEVRSLLAAYAAVIATHPATGSRLRPFAAETRAHDRALSGPPGALATPSARTPSSRDERQLVAGAGPGAGDLGRCPGLAGRARARGSGTSASSAAARRAGPGPAARVGRGERGHACGADRAPGMSARSETATLQEVLAAEHAVVFGYGVAGAHLAGADRERALAGWSAHGDWRDRLAGLIAARGATPVPPAASYALPSPVRSAHDAVALLAELEERLADVWAERGRPADR